MMKIELVIKNNQLRGESKMSIEIYMPRLGLTMQEGTIVSWLKKEGEAVVAGEGVLEITSEKISNVVEATGSGILEKQLFTENETVPSGTVIGYIRETNEVLGSANEEISEIWDTKADAISNAQEILDKSSIDSDREILEIIPLVGTRKIIAERMEESLKRSPQASVTTRVDMSGLVSLREAYAAEEIKYSYTDFLIKIVALALQENPLLNASVQDGKILVYKSINIGVAVAAGNELIVPVIKNVQEKNLAQISQEVKDLTRKAKEGGLEGKDLRGGTFTISNMGMFHVDVMTPILNMPEVAILALGTARREVVVSDKDDSWQIKPMATLSLTIDHAALDGLPAAQFLETVSRIVSNPGDYLR